MFGRKKKDSTKGGSEIYRHELPENQGWRPPVMESSFAEEVAGYFDKQFPGRETVVFHEIISDLVHIDVNVMKPIPEDDIYVLYTTGMSDLPMTLPPQVKNPDELKFAELVMLLPSSWSPGGDYAISTDLPEKDSWAIGLIKFFARFPHEYKTWLGDGHTVPNGNYQPITDGSEMGGVILLSFNAPPLAAKGGETVNFYLVLPISQVETEYKLEHGTGELVERLKEGKVSFVVDINRKSVL